MSMDIDAVHKLLNVVAMATQHPLLRSIHTEAMNALMKIDADLGVKQAEEKKAEAAKKVSEEAQAAAKLKGEQEMEIKKQSRPKEELAPVAFRPFTPETSHEGDSRR